MRKSHTHPYHLSHEEIASFIEGSTGEVQGARIQVHLQSCDDCLEAYRYAVRYRGMYDGSPATDAPSKQAIRAAKAIAERDFRRDEFERRGKLRWISGLNPTGRWALSAAVVALFVASVFWLRPLSTDGGFDPLSEALSPVTRAMVTASERNPLVLPGVEFEIGPAPEVLRSGPAAINGALDDALSELAVSYNDGALSNDETQWLIGGYLATGQVENARVYITNALARHPQDLDLLVLRGILAYMDNDLARAREMFEVAVGKDSDNVVAAFNLAVVEEELGQAAAARRLYRRVSTGAPGSTLANRAEAALSKLL